MKRLLAARIALLVLPALMLVANPALAKKDGKSEAGGWGGFGPYVGFFNPDDFNKFMADRGFDQEKLARQHFMFGGGGLAVVDRVTIGGYGFGGHQRSSSAAKVLYVDYGFGAFELGYLLLCCDHLKLGPALGIGGGGYTLTLTPSSRTLPSFDTLLENGVQSWTISNSSFTLAPAITVLVPINWVGLMLKGGYLYSPAAADWKIGDIPIAAPAPPLHSSGPFLSLQVVFGGSNNGKHTRL
jgi:hypothetical protein